MPQLTISADQTHICLDGQPHAICADTIWSAFSDIASGEWTAYLRKRKLQGFNALLISILPILHDRTIKAGAREPFAVNAEGHYDFAAPNAAYFDHARRMVEEARAAGMTPILVVLWGNYAEGSKFAEKTPWSPIPDKERQAYVDLVAEKFSDLDPIFAISGDDDLMRERPVEIFLSAMEQIKQRAPHCLTTLHTTPSSNPHDSLVNSDALDFYVYQSGHHFDGQDKIITLAELLLAKRRRPVINAEPCYELHGKADGEGRFSAFDVRRATWLSMLAGASAGMGYGAHGVWQWHRPGGTFNNPGFSRVPLTWQAALNLRGATDVGFATRLLADFGLVGATACQDRIIEGEASLRVAQRNGTMAAYTPFTQAIRLKCEMAPKAIIAYDLEERSQIGLDHDWADGVLSIGQPDIIADFVVFVTT